jgi:hypothetical protein
MIPVTWLVLFTTYLFSMPGTFYFEDSPELLAAASVLGNTHPPGYSLMALAGRLALLVPAGSPAFRLNLLVAAAGALAAALTGLLVRGMASRWAGPRVSTAAGILAAGVIGFSDAFWWESVIGDKYAFLYLGFAATAWAAHRYLARDLGHKARGVALLGLVFGLALAHHQYAVFGLPVAAAVLLNRRAFVMLGARGWFRAVLLAVVVAGLPLSVRLVYPPVRSAGGAAMDWGMPSRVKPWLEYGQARMYHGGFVHTSIPANPRLAAGRAGLAWRFLREEVPWPFLVGVPIGLAGLVVTDLPLAAGLSLSALADAIYCANYSEKIARWYVPAYIVVVVLASLGFLMLVGATVRTGRPRARAAVLLFYALVLLGPAVQLKRNAGRNALSRFTAAHDLGRHVLRSLPPGAVYLGAGDFDLFPLWALGWAEGERSDVYAVGLGPFVDPNLAGAGGQASLLKRRGIVARDAWGLAALLKDRDGPPVYISTISFDPDVIRRMPFLRVMRISGLVGRLSRHVDPVASAALTARAARAMTFRNILYAPAGTVAVMKRPRDEVARGAFLAYPASFIEVGYSSLRYGLLNESLPMYRRAALLMSALAPGSESSRPASLGEAAAPPGEAAGGPALPRIMNYRASIALGYHRLADVFEERGVTFLADNFRSSASAVTQ